MPALERLVSSLVAASARSGVVVAEGGANVSSRAPPLLNEKVKPGAFPSALVSSFSSTTTAAMTTAAAAAAAAAASSSTLPLGTPARILADVLVAFPSLYWRPVLLRSALACCSAEEKMASAWKMACCRLPTPQEQQTLRGFLANAGDTPSGWAQLCHALMQSGEFQVVY